MDDNGISYDYEAHLRALQSDVGDIIFPALKRMYYKRLKAYKKIGYEVCSEIIDKQEITNSIFDSQRYFDIFEKDVISAGVNVITRHKYRERFAIIDKSLVWYGSMTLLSNEKEDDSLMRISNPAIAEELLDFAKR